MDLQMCMKTELRQNFNETTKGENFKTSTALLPVKLFKFFILPNNEIPVFKKVCNAYRQY